MLGSDVTNECCPVGLAKPLAHAAFEPNAGFVLGEEGAPTFGSTVPAERLDVHGCGAGGMGSAAAEAEEW